MQLIVISFIKHVIYIKCGENNKIVMGNKTKTYAKS